MNTQPKPTGEWTANYVASFIRESYESPGSGSLRSIADAHNAALAAEREISAGLKNELHAALLDLTAERERHAELVRENESLVDALKFFSSVIKSGESWSATCQKAYDDALAKVGTYPLGGASDATFSNAA